MSGTIHLCDITNKKTFMLVPEEQLTPFYNLPNKPENELNQKSIEFLLSNFNKRFNSSGLGF